MDDADIRRGLLAERRSLLITSFVLFFYQRAGLKIDELNVLGNKATLTDAWWVEFAMWALWAYFALRYLQYFMAVRDSEFRRSFQSWLEWYLVRTHFRRAKSTFKEEAVRKRKSLTSATLRSGQANGDPSFPTETVLQILTRHQQQDTVQHSQVQFRSPVTAKQLRWAKPTAVLCALIFSHPGTEYFLPFLVALIPVVSAFFDAIGWPALPQ